jgi:FkbM family methyltransferase
VDDLVRRLDLDHIDLLHADIQGAELQMLHGMRNVIREGRVRFIFISTHHHSISDDPLIHQKCLRFLREHSAHILSEHTVAESFSGDGLIVASFAPEDRALPHIPLTLNRAGDNLFPEPEADLALARDELRRARQAIASARLALPAWVRTTSLEAGADVSTLLAALEQEREMAARPIRSPLRRSQPRSNVERAEAVRSNPMAPLKSLVSTFRGAIWLLRGSGLREQVRALGRRLDGLQAQMTESAHAAAALSRAARSRAVVRGHAMLLNPDDNVVSRLLAESGGIEWFETDLIEREVHEGDTVLDLGANIGYFTLQFARLVGPRGRVIAFEPDPVNANLLKRNVSLNGYHNVEIVRKAVADRTGESELHLCDNNHGDHRLYSSGDGRTTIKVPMTTIDDHFGANPPAVNLIKMDIQGSEPRALRGMDRTLKNSPSASLITEFWPIGLSQAGDSAAGFLTQLQRLGFDISEICESEERLQPIESLQLLRDYTPENSRHTNLFCTRGRA